MFRSHRRVARAIATSALLLVTLVPAGFHNLPPAKAAEAKTTNSIALPGHAITVPGPVQSAR